MKLEYKLGTNSTLLSLHYKGVSFTN